MTKPALRWYQKETVDYIIRNRLAYLNLYMGLGKSRCCIEVANDMSVKKMLVICPLAVIDTWTEEYEKWGDGTLRILTDEVADSWSVDKMAEFLTKMTKINRNYMIVLNFAKLVERKKAVNALIKLLYSIEWDMIVVDEAHKIKSSTSASAKTCHKLGKLNYNSIKIAQSGTPLPHSPMDAFSQYQFLDHEVFGESFHYHKNKWFMTNEYGGYLTIFDQDKFKELIHSRMISFEEGLVELPETMHQKILIDLEPKAYKIYKSIEKDFYVQLEKGELSVSNALTKLLRLSQTTGGYLPLDDVATDEKIVKRVERVSRAKADAVAELLDDISINEPVVIFYRFETDKQQLYELIGDKSAKERKVYELSGKRNDLQAWKEDTSGSVLIVQIQSGNAGVSFVRAKYCIYYSVGYSAGDFEQSVKRLHRSGQDRNVIYYHILCKRTVDEKIYQSISAKMKVAREILNTSNSDDDIITYLMANKEQS